MQEVIAIGIPLITILIMVSVGLGLTLDDFRRLFRRPRTLITGTLCQITILPLIALLILYVIPLPAPVSVGLLLVASSPGGALSNLYVHLAGENTALSVSLTAMTTMAAILYMPPLLGLLLSSLVRHEIEIVIPPLELIKTLFIGLLIPVLSGMLIRHHWPRFVARHLGLFTRLSILLVALLVLTIAVDQSRMMLELGIEMVATAIIFSLFTLSAGWLFSILLRVHPEDQLALMIEFSVRNLAVVALIGAGIAGHLDFAAFGAVFLVIQAMIMLLLITFYRGVIKNNVRKRVQ